VALEVQERVLSISRSVAESIASIQPVDLRRQLEELAEVLTSLLGIPGAAIVAFDEEGNPLTSGAYGLSFNRESSQLDILFSLKQQLEFQSQPEASFVVDSAFVRRDEDPPGDGQVLAVPVRCANRTLGLVLVATTGSAPSLVLDSIAHSGEILAAAIQSSLRAEAWNRIERLQQLAWTTFDQPKWDLPGLARELAKLFEADAVTMLLNEQGDLRLAASTDPQLGKDKDKPVLYKPGQGLTGYVFEKGTPLRLNDTGDRAEIKRAVGVNREEATHPERDSEGQFTGQFLGVCMRFGGKRVGVLRMSRRRGIARFTREDEKALQFFADLLGAAFAPAWDLLLKRSVIESVTELIAVSKRERSDDVPVSHIILANPGAEKLLGRSREEIEGLEVSEIYDPKEFAIIRQKLKPALEEGRGTFGPITTRLKKSDGALVPVVISYRFLANDLVFPPTLYTLGLARDISESEHLAAQHRRLLELLGAMKAAYFSADQDGITQVSTPTDRELTGYSEDELRKMSRDKLFHNPTELAQLLNKAREQEGQLALVRGMVVRMRRKDGTTFWAEGDLRILRDPQGREIGREGLYRDVTDRIRLQGFLNADTQRVLSDDELFSRLKQDAEFHLDYMSSLGHQLQTPLGSLVETLRNFETGVVSQKDLVSRLPYVIGQAVVCTRLVRNLSYMDKILSGEKFERERVSLAKLAIETKLDFIHLLREKRLELHVDDESLDRLLRVQGHGEMLRQVLVNLIDNAIKYSSPGTTINIRGRQWPEGPAFEITSQGLPIPDGDREKIFQRGFRTRKAATLVPHGTGLGLWLVRKIVEAHGASIRCQEIFEGGQKRILFRITFPGYAANARRAS
jgi:PAS domain S-box-containing protein